ncbi:dienelactone hydrolase family protein [Actinomadura sp. HBU206391]|uniref:dienelactone hydrolase family protein n=1 Tax=Actinomadura sp. HBU206391 TaxID=2731692 RepID=UPI0016508707|nr:dienelactone hydrolase family protein [Actinomadura sp. HBU206391]MBC6459815.1 dienelactone hydrolase family protein [Actinomadura sp. HBU206391]
MHITEESKKIAVTGATLEADVVVPEQAQGVVLFAHGSGSGRHSPRNRHVAGELQRAGLITVLADLLTPAEEQRDAWTGELRFDIGLLTSRLTDLTDWVVAQERTRGLGVGLFGASTGAAAALATAARRPSVQAVVSRGGRPDLAGEALSKVLCPTLLIVGGLDSVVIEINREAMRQLAGEASLEIVPGASHLFEEPGTLEQVAMLARDWFIRHLRPVARPAREA